MEGAHWSLDLRPFDRLPKGYGVSLVVERPARLWVAEDALVVALESRAAAMLEQLPGQAPDRVDADLEACVGEDPCRSVWRWPVCWRARCP
jgi:hypothetical protein